MIWLEAPGIQTYRNVVGQDVGTGEIEIDHTGQCATEKKYIIGEQVGVDHAMRQIVRPQLFAVRELGGNVAGEIFVHVVGAWRRLRIERAPAFDGQRIFAPDREISAGNVQLCKSFANSRAMRCVRSSDPHAVEERDDGGRTLHELAQRLASAVLHRLRTGETARMEVLHQANEKWQVLRGDTLLIEREDVITTAGVQQKIRIFDAFIDAF